MRLAVLAVAFLLAAVGTAQAAFPGQNGKIAFSDWSSEGTFFNADGIYTMDPDGSDVVELTTSPPLRKTNPAWSPDGTRIAYGEGGGTSSNRNLVTINADGTDKQVLAGTEMSEDYPSWSPDGQHIAFGQSQGDIFVVASTGGPVTQLTDDGWLGGPAWSPDGTKIAFHQLGIGGDDIFVMDADGTDIVNVTNDPGGREMNPSWSPDGSQIVFSSAALLPDTPFHDDHQIQLMQADGSGRHVVFDDPDRSDIDPAWSPDGTRIVFMSHDTLYTIDPDGSNPTPLRTGIQPDWQPIPVNSYPRPKGATPFQVYLVPAYEPCTSPNRTHGPPLAFGSCDPPAQTSARLTVGTADSNGRPAKSIALVRFDTLAGVPSTPADEADVQLTASVADVYEQGSLADYAGALRARVGLRITDKLNTPHPGGPGAGTVADTALAFSVPCVPTVDTTVGASCALSSSVDALIPGTVTEGRRSIWALGQVALDDTGADGDPATPGDNDAFLRQGLFIP